MKTFLRSIGLALILALAIGAPAPSRAVVTSTTNSNTLTADGGTRAFAFTFPCLDASWVQVSLDTVVQSSGYTVALNANQTTSPGGTVTFSIAPLSSTAVKMQRATPFTQLKHWTPYTAFPAAKTEAAFDQLTMAMQDAVINGGGVVGPQGPPGSTGPTGPVDTTALTLAGSKTKVFYQDHPPVDADAAPDVLHEGDIWFDTSTYVDNPATVGGTGATKIKYTATRWHIVGGVGSWVDANATKLIVASEIAAGAIVADKVAANAITTDALAANAITAAKIATGTITATQIQTGTITADRLNANVLQTSNYTQDLSGNPTAGAKLDSTGTALKVAAGNLQIGSTVFNQAVQFLHNQRLAGTNSTLIVNFSTAFPDTNYAILVTPVAGTSAATGSWRVLQVTKYVGYATIQAEAAPGADSTHWVEFDVLAVRY